MQTTRQLGAHTSVVALSLMSMLFVAACGGDGGGNPTGPSSTPTPTTTVFQGALVGVGETGTLDVTIQTTVAVTALSLTRRPQVASGAAGSLQLAGGASSISLTGTYEDTTRQVTMSGGGFTFGGEIAANGADLTGAYAGPGASGGFALLNTREGPVTSYCGTFVGAGGGRVVMSISAGGTVSGGWVNTANGDSGNISGQRSGISLDLTSDSGISLAGTQSGDSLSGTWNNAIGGGTWHANTVGCQEVPPVPSATFRLTVVTTGNGQGRVTSRPAGIRCGRGQSDCTEDYSQGAVVTLTAVPAMGSVFGGWSGGADCTDGKVTMLGARRCTATFKAGSRITFSVSGNVTRVDAGLEGRFNRSQTMSASWVVDSLAADQNSNPQRGVYSLSSFAISVDGFAPTVTGGSHITSDNFNVDGLEVNITDPFGATIAAPPVVPGQRVFQIILNFTDSSSLLFASDALTTDFTLGDFSDAVWSIRFGQIVNGTHIEFGRVSGNITSLQISP